METTGSSPADFRYFSSNEPLSEPLSDEDSILF